MGNVIDLQRQRDRRLAMEHARALVLFECAAKLARQGHPGLQRLIEQSFGSDYIEQRVQATLPRDETSSGGRRSG